MKSKQVLAILSLFLVSLVMAGMVQENDFRVTGKVRVEQGLVDGSEIELYLGNQLQQKAIINRTGNFVFVLKIGQNYHLRFLKEGFYSKEIEIDTHIPPEICSADCQFPPYQLSVFLLKSVPGVEFGPPVAGRIAYNRKIDNFDVVIEEGKAPDLKQIIENSISESRQKSQKLEKENFEKRLKSFRTQMAGAESYTRSRQYQEALESYRAAALLFPFDLQPREQIDQLFRLSAIYQLEQSFGKISEQNWLKYLNYADAKTAEREATLAMVAYELVLKVKPDNSDIRSKYNQARQDVEDLHKLALNEVQHKQQLAEKQIVRYKELIDDADVELRAENFIAARDQYALAAGQTDENSYALLMLKRIDEIFNDSDQAKKKAREQEEQEKLMIRQAREKAYHDAIAEADRLFENRLYRDAIEAYELALTIKSWEPYPTGQIRIIKDLLARLQISGAEYNSLLRLAEDQYNQNNYQLARTTYQAAHNLLPTETFALARIRQIDDLLARLERETENERQYRKVIASADSLFNLKSYQPAISAYQQALVLKKNEPYPNEQILKIRELIARENGSQRAALQQQTAYEQALASADKAFNEKQYQTARPLYVKALTIKPGETYPSQQITLIDNLFQRQSTAESASAILDRIDFNQLDKISRNELETAFREAMRLGNSFFVNHEWAIARFYFRKALVLVPGDNEAQSKLNDVEMQIRGGNANEALYQEMIRKGDEAFRSGDFAVARFYYTKALDAKPSDPYASERLEVTRHMISSESQRSANREFDQAIARGDEAAAAGNYPVARFFYRKALQLKPDDRMATQKINNMEKQAVDSKSNADNQTYRKLIDQADRAFENRQYAVSKNYYQQAISVLPDNEYPKRQITRIDSLIRR